MSKRGNDDPRKNPHAFGGAYCRQTTPEGFIPSYSLWDLIGPDHEIELWDHRSVSYRVEFKVAEIEEGSRLMCRELSKVWLVTSFTPNRLRPDRPSIMVREDVPRCTCGAGPDVPLANHDEECDLLV